MFGRKKQAKENFAAEKMPHNRLQAFSDVYRCRFSLIMKLGLISLLFMLPVAAVILVTDMKVYETGMMVDAGSLTAIQRAQTVFGLINAGNLVMIASLVIFAVGLSGISGVVRRLVRQEGILFGADFSRSIKENAFSFCLTAAICGALNYFLTYSLRNLYFDDGAGAQAALIASAVAAALFAPTALFVLAQSTVYNLPYHKKFFNAFLLAMRTSYLSFPVVLLNAAPFLLLLIPSEYMFLPLLLLLPLFAVPALTIADTLYCDFVLDKFINKTNFPEIYDKGIWRNADSKSR